jgi:hypothetical protein
MPLALMQRLIPNRLRRACQTVTLAATTTLRDSDSDDSSEVVMVGDLLSSSLGHLPLEPSLLSAETKALAQAERLRPLSSLSASSGVRVSV